MANAGLAGSIFDSAGAGIGSVTIRTFESTATDTSAILATTTTNSTGAWTLADAGSGKPDVKLINNGEVTWFKYRDQVAFSVLSTPSVVIQDTAGAQSSLTVTLTTGGGLSADQTLTLPNQTGTLVTSSGSTNEMAFSVANLTADRVFTMMDTPGFIPTDAALITGANASGTNLPITIHKTANEANTSSDYVTDTHLQLAMASAAVYSVEVCAIVSASATSISIGRLTVPTGANFDGLSNFAQNSSIQGVAATEASSMTLSSAGSNNATFLLNGRCETSATTGTFGWQFRRAVAGNSGVTMGIGSYLKVQKMSS